MYGRLYVHIEMRAVFCGSPASERENRSAAVGDVGAVGVAVSCARSGREGTTDTCLQCGT